MILILGCTSTRNARKEYTTVILDGTASKIIGGGGQGYFKNWEWEQILGQSHLIDNPSLMQTQTKVTSGSYAWELTGIDNLGNVGKDTFFIKIK